MPNGRSLKASLPGPRQSRKLSINLQTGQLFRAAIKFAADGAQPNQTYLDNGFMSDLLAGAVTTFNQQVALWMRSANRLIYHNESARTDEIRTTLSNEFNAHSPGFVTPNVTPAGLISA